MAVLLFSACLNAQQRSGDTLSFKATIQNDTVNLHFIVNPWKDSLYTIALKTYNQDSNIKTDKAVGKISMANNESYNKSLNMIYYELRLLKSEALDSLLSDKAYIHLRILQLEATLKLKDSTTKEIQKKYDKLSTDVKTGNDTLFLSKDYYISPTNYSVKVKMKDSTNRVQIEICPLSGKTLNCDTIIIALEEPKSEYEKMLNESFNELNSSKKDQDEYKKGRDAISARIYDDWESKIEEIRREKVVRKKELELEAQMRRQLDLITGVVDSLTLKKDTAFVEIKLHKNLPLYKVDSALSRKRFYAKDKTYRSEYRHFKRDTSVSIRIESAKLHFEHGYLTSMILTPDSASIIKYGMPKTLRFTNYFDLRSSMEAPYLLDHYLPIKRFAKKLFIDKRSGFNSRTSDLDGLYFFNLKDFMDYESRIDDISDVLVHLRNKNISLEPGKVDVQTFKLKEKDFSSFAQLNIFTDLIGLSENKPNGLIQVEGKFETDIFRSPINFNKNNAVVRWFILSQAQANLSLNKIEDKLRYLDVSKDSIYLNYYEKNYDTLPSKRTHLNNIRLLQYSSLNIGASTRLFEILSDYFRGFVHVGVGVVRTPIRDSVLIKTTTGENFLKGETDVLNTIRITYGAVTQFKSNHDLGLELGLQFTNLRLNSSSYKQSFNEYFRPADTTINKQTRFWRNTIINPSVKIYYFLDKEQSKRLFIRTEYFRDLKTKADDFFTFQFGYSTDLKGVFGMFSNNKNASDTNGR